jgi:5-dehydro-2-deoxygluconokinase
MLRASAADLEYVSSARIFITNGTSLCASPSRESTYLALERAKEAGCQVVLDVDYRAMSWNGSEEAGLAIRLALPFVDMLLGNPQELKLVAGEDDLDRACAKLRRRGVPLLISKLGDEGSCVWDGEERVFEPPCPVDVVSTIGAGDGFAAGFLAAHLRGLPVPDCLRYGNASAAIVVSRLSCSEAMPSLAEVEELLRRHH